jgi:hypothetical protein
VDCRDYVSSPVLAVVAAEPMTIRSDRLSHHTKIRVFDAIPGTTSVRIITHTLCLWNSKQFVTVKAIVINREVFNWPKAINQLASVREKSRRTV